MATGERTVVKGVCPLDCPDTCSMRVTVEDGVAVDLRGDPEHPFTRGFLCQKMARYLDRVYSRRPAPAPAPAGRAEGRGPVRADRLGRGAGDDRRAVRRDREVGATARRRSCRTAITGRWASSRRAASTGGSSTGSGPRCSTGPSAPRPGRSGTSTPSAAAGSAPTRWGCLAAGSSSTGARTRSTPTATSGAGWSPARKRRRDDRHDRPLSEPDRREVRLAHRPPPRHRRRAGARGHARDLARGPAGRRLPRTGDDRGPPAPRSRLERVSARSRRGHHGRRGRDDRRVRPPVCPRTALADPPELRPPAPSRRRDGGADDRLPARAGGGLATPRRRGPAHDERDLRLRHGPAHPPRPLPARARARST